MAAANKTLQTNNLLINNYTVYWNHCRPSHAVLFQRLNETVRLITALLIDKSANRRRLSDRNTGSQSGWTDRQTDRQTCCSRRSVNFSGTQHLINYRNRDLLLLLLFNMLLNKGSVWHWYHASQLAYIDARLSLLIAKCWWLLVVVY